MQLLANPRATRILIMLLVVGLMMAFAADPAVAQECPWDHDGGAC